MQSSRENVVIDFGVTTGEEHEPLLDLDAALTQKFEPPIHGVTMSHDIAISIPPTPEALNAEAQELVGEPGCGAKMAAGVKYSTVYILSGISAAPSALNAFAGPSGQGPENIGEAWWNSMSTGRQVYSVGSGVSSFTVNTIMNALFIPVAAQKLWAGLRDMRLGPRQATTIIAALILAVGAGVSAGAISWSSFSWLSFNALATIPTVLSFVITFAGRFIGIKNIFNRIANLFNADARLQQELADKIEHIDADYLQQMEQKVQNIIEEKYQDNNGKPLNDEQYQAVILAFGKELDLLASDPNLINSATTCESIAKYAGLLCDLIAAVTIMTPAFMTFTQKGFDGVNILSKMLSGHSLDGLAASSKALIGFIPGAASGVFYANAGLDFRDTMMSMIKYLFEHPGSIPAAVGLLAANGIASNSMTNVGQGVLKKADNIFGLANGAYGTAYLTTLTIGGAMVNTKASVTKAFLCPSEPAAQDVTLSHLKKRLHNADDHPISKEIAGQLRGLGIFAKPAALNTPVQPQHSSNNFVFEG